MERREFTITCVRRDEAGHWTAHVSIDGETFNATREHGSWEILHGGGRRHMLTPVAQALQARVRPLEKVERGRDV